MLRPVASRRWRATALAVLAATLVLGSVGTAQAAPAGTALDFDGANDYVTFGNPAALGLSTFTLSGVVQARGGRHRSDDGSRRWRWDFPEAAQCRF